MAINLDVHGNTQPLESAVQAAVNRIRRTPIKITVDDRGATQPLGNMRRGADEFTKSMEAANARILAFGASMAIINGIADSFKAMVGNMVEVEKAMADINVVMGLSAQNLEKFGDGLFKVAKETGAAFRVAADAATEYARQGLTVEESLKRTRDALILTRLTGMDSAEAVKSLTAAMNTYGHQIEDTTQLVSKFAAVDVQFAVSAEDFAQAISRTGAAAKDAGVDIDELIGIVTAAQQQTARGGAVIGNSLKTIFTRVGRTDTLNQLENLGIAVRDLEGNTLGAKRILTDLANTFDTLSEAQKAQIAQTVGGVFQINILKAILGDAAKQNGILAKATEISASATDEAIDKNEQLRNTMSAMATETGLALKELSSQIGEIMLAPGAEKILNAVKSLSEGVSGALGDGESLGGKFASGVLKGIGNIITGPGLVMIVAVLGKLMGQAFKFTKESLTSLIGVTSEAQKQKAIQTSLVTLFGQNAALNKEMLRTDISRTEKEKIILGLLQAQTVEANKLNAISKQLASTLYTRGYGPGLTKGKSRAYGHIPNFADSERAQAAKGGYAAGSIRTMNMPGEGSVIYNSAETVKNFAGFKQPAIMPPQSSKAGKNYQQAFGNIHGFDPYAAGGYIPNYAKAETYNKDGKMVLFAASAEGAGSYAGRDRRNNIIYLNPSSMKFSKTDDGKGGMVPVNVPYFTIGRNDAERSKNDPKIKNKIEGDLVNQAQKTTNHLVNQIFKTPSIPNVIKSADVAVAVGNVFEKILMSVQKGVAKEAYDPDPPGNALLDIPRGGRDALWDLFGASPLGGLGAEAKIALGSGDNATHLKSAAEKFYKIDSYKGIGGAKAMAFAPAGKVSQKNLASLGFTSELQEYINKRGGEGDPRVPGRRINWSFTNWPKNQLSNLEKLKNDFYSKQRAYGHIPNFAANSWESEPKWKWSMNPDYIAFQKKKNQEELNKRISKFGNSNISLTGKYSGNLPIARITDPQTGTYTDFTYGKGSGETGNSTSIIYSSRGKKDQKGGAFRNFEILGDFTSKQGGKDRSIYSDFDQINVAAGKSPWAMVLRAFPQLKQRIRPGMVTSGEMNIGYDTLPFNSLRSLKMQVSKWVKQNGLKAFLDYSKANLGFNEKNAILGGTSSGDLFSIGGLRTRMLTRRDKNYLNDSKVGFAASGYIPNFADPLSDAIGREKAAGVPVSQIRVGSHSALMSKGNPLGLGVTNTYDEPNGLRDVFGANGFVPNYATPSVSAGDIVPDPKFQRLQKTQQQLADQYNKQLKIRIDRLRKGNYQYKDFERSVKTLNDRYNVSSNARSQVNKELRKEIGFIQRNNLSRQQMSTQFQKSSLGRATSKMGGMFGGNFGMMAMMGAPMAAGFLQGDGAGQTGAGGIMYAAGGALQGAATGGMMASMMAPMFGPAAPLVIGIGALGGAIHGVISASEENTKALKENAKNMGGQIAKSMISSPIISEALSGIGKDRIEKIEKIAENPLYKENLKKIEEKYTPKKLSLLGFEYTPDMNELDKAAMASEKDPWLKAMTLDAAQQRKDLVMKALQNIPKGEEFMAKSLNMVDGKYDLKERMFNRETYLKEIEKLDPKEQVAQEALEQIFEDQVTQAEKASVNLSKENKAIILRLNLQKAIMFAQMQAKEAQIDIKEKYFKQSNMIEAQTKILGGLMSEEQKARLDYNKSLIKNTETREAGERAAKDAMRLGILQDIKGSQGGGLEQALKKALFEGTDESELKDITFEDLTAALDTKDAEQLLAILTEIGEKDDKANKIQEQRTAQFNAQISILDKQKTLSDNIATAEYKTNDAIGKRKDLMQDVNREMQEYIRGLDYAAQKRAIESEIQSARFSAGPVRSQQEVFADMQRKVGERQKSIREEYTKSAISEMKSFADELGLTEQQRLEVADDPNKLKGAAVSFYDKEQSNFNAKYGQKMKMLEEESVPLSEKIDKGEKITDSEMRNLEEYSKLIDLQNNLNSVKEETLKKSGEISGKLQEQLDITEQKIKKEEELQRIKEKEYLRRTGPGAFGEGMKDAAKNMRKEIALMDYELGKKIPNALANGLATAMSEGLSGAKSIGDALRDSAINFLQMMQKAMMQKAASNIVSMLPFSRGGSVRNYSRGGGVPAMVTNGEYVMGKEAVSKYGGSFMHGLNAGGRSSLFSTPGFNQGGSVGLDGTRYKSGKAYQSKKMSGLFYAMEESPALKDDASKLSDALAEKRRKEEEANQAAREKAARRNARANKIISFIGSVAAAGITSSIINAGKLTGVAKAAGYGADTPAGVNMAIDSSGMAVSTLPGADLAGSGFTNVTATRSWNPMSWGSPSTINPNLGPFFWNNRRQEYFGGPIGKYASGGYISGKSGIDQIPAMLSEGEYVIRASSARQIGRPMLDRINAGKFNDGGLVNGTSEASNSASSPGNTNQSSGDVNINISVNLEKGTTSETQDSSNNQGQEEAMQNMGKKIKDQVLAVIVEEKRPGGLLQE